MSLRLFQALKCLSGKTACGNNDHIRVNLLIIFLFVILFSSCLTSLQNLVTQKNITGQDQVEGVWMAGNTRINILRFNKCKYSNLFAEARESKTPFTEEDSVFISRHYFIQYVQAGLDYAWLGGFVKVNGSMYVSLKAVELMKAGKDITPSGAVYSDSYSFAKVEWPGPGQVKLSFPDGEMIKQIILENKARIRHEYDPLFGAFIITASSNELYSFFSKYGGDERLYKNGVKIILNKKG